VLGALNAEYFVLTQYEGKCRVAFFEETELKRKVLRLQSFQDFENAQGNKFICLGANQEGVPIMVPRGKWWLTHKSRREYKSLIFAPHAGQVVDDKLNLWTGYGAEVLDEWPAEGAPPEQCCALYLVHLKNNVCVNSDGTPNSVYYEYMLNWMAFGAQFPELPGKVVPVLKGDEGVGKGVAITEWGKLFGSHFLTITNSKHLVGHFNAHLRDCVALHANEAFYAGDKAHESILKTLVTDDYLMVEPKGRDASLSANHLHIMMSSNEAWVVPMNESARRFWVLNVAKYQQKNAGYFKAIGKQMDDGGRQALLYLLLHRDISNFDVEAFPETEAGNEQKEITRGPLADRLAGLTGQERAEVFDKETGKTIREERITSNHILYDHLHVQSHAEAMFVSRALPKAMLSLGWTGPKKVCLRDAPPIQGYVRPFLGPAGQCDMWPADEPCESA